ncbi:NAD-dependent epimerase/dehydratase family protein [Mangrovibacterium sp.]|uniref:NAD-dependent epimerase/dehydratase family protein n=1 Tax=Mangrovibacterium sp. TaxID=1961364 RepID=UPI0035698113
MIAGATGLVGSELMKMLIRDNTFSNVIILSRRETGFHHEKIAEYLVDFNQPETWQDLVRGDILFSCMGTTIKSAGSQEKQYLVDFTYQYEIAKAAAQNGVDQYILISSAGANSNSKLFYSRIKGELEEKTRQLPFRKISILRPSLLLGNRPNKRFGEQLAQKIIPFITRFVFKKYRPISGTTVAQGMIKAALSVDSRQLYELDEIFKLAE